MGTIVYWMTNLYNSVKRYFILQGILVLCGLVSSSIGKIKERYDCFNRQTDICVFQEHFSDLLLEMLMLLVIY